jgi:hypothetical protein
MGWTTELWDGISVRWGGNYERVLEGKLALDERIVAQSGEKEHSLYTLWNSMYGTWPNWKAMPRWGATKELKRFKQTLNLMLTDTGTYFDFYWVDTEEASSGSYDTWFAGQADGTLPPELAKADVLSRAGAPSDWFDSTPHWGASGDEYGWKHLPAIVNQLVWLAPRSANTLSLLETDNNSSGPASSPESGGEPLLSDVDSYATLDAVADAAMLAYTSTASASVYAYHSFGGLGPSVQHYSRHVANQVQMALLGGHNWGPDCMVDLYYTAGDNGSWESAPMATIREGYDSSWIYEETAKYKLDKTESGAAESDFEIEMGDEDHIPTKPTGAPESYWTPAPYEDRDDWLDEDPELDPVFGEPEWFSPSTAPVATCVTAHILSTVFVMKYDVTGGFEYIQEETP